METGVARTETKYAIDDLTAARLRGALDLLMRRDAMGGTDGYTVRSLYFDTPLDQDYLDKMDGLEERQKVRLRIYSPEDRTAKLELKRKIGKYQWKKSLTVTRDDAQLVVSGQYARLRERVGSPFGGRLLSMMERQVYRPRTLVEFRRLAYVAPIENTRVTFDTGLCASQSARDLFAPTPAYHPILHPVILEVKCTNVLASHIKFALGIVDQLPVSISKYCLGRQVSFY